MWLQVWWQRQAISECQDSQALTVRLTFSKTKMTILVKITVQILCFEDLVYFMCMNALLVCMCVHHVHAGAHRSQKRTLDALEPMFQWLKVTLWVLGIEYSSFLRAAGALMH